MHKNMLNYCREYDEFCKTGKAPRTGVYTTGEFMQIYDFCTEKGGGVNANALYNAIYMALHAGYVTGYKAAQKNARKKTKGGSGSDRSPEEVGEILRKLRGTRSRTQTAERLAISPEALAAYESGERLPRDEVKARIAEFYNMPIDSIF